ncbi:MAG: MFS transporter [Eubacteriales bacterium]|nr:MFS transporter [Eubacteriales bacterium]
MNKLWDKNFTIITLGSVISMLGNAVSGFAIGLLVLDMTGSTFLYALFMVIYNIPHIFAPMIAGPYMDRFSRKKTIYILDFISAGLYGTIFLFLNSGLLSYPIMLFVTLIIGSIDGVYAVAYESLYPNLVKKGNFTKAYSISSMIFPLAAFMVPVASVVYSKLDSAAPLFLFNALTFFIAACFETRIDYTETHIREDSKKSALSLKRFKKDFREGINYIISEKGLLVITAYFCITTFSSSAVQTLLLPFFKNNAELFSGIDIDAVTLFTLVAGAGVLGRLIGGVIHYFFKYPVDKKFTIALCVYAVVTVLEGVYLYFPFPLMTLSFFTVGILGVTSYNIRISATQSYLPDEKRGRFNGAFQMVCTLGSIVGQLSAGILAEWIHERYIIMGYMFINLIAILLIMYRGRSHVKLIYNTQS